MFIQIIRLDPDIIQINIIEFQVSTCIIVRQSGFGYQADLLILSFEEVPEALTQTRSPSLSSVNSDKKSFLCGILIFSRDFFCKERSLLKRQVVRHELYRFWYLS